MAANEPLREAVTESYPGAAYDRIRNKCLQRGDHGIEPGRGHAPIQFRSTACSRVCRRSKRRSASSAGMIAAPAAPPVAALATAPAVATPKRSRNPRRSITSNSCHHVSNRPIPYRPYYRHLRCVSLLCAHDLRSLKQDGLAADINFTYTQHLICPLDLAIVAQGGDAVRGSA